MKNSHFFQKIKSGLNRWTIFSIVVVSSAITILYVYNVIKVNTLMKDVQDLSKKYELLKNNNKLLQEKINELESPERIIKIAQTQLGMILNDSVPEIIEISNP